MNNANYHAKIGRDLVFELPDHMMGTARSNVRGDLAAWTCPRRGFPLFIQLFRPIFPRLI
jgi:hypothetical protein